MKNRTTISLTNATKKALDNHKLCNDESYESCMIRMIHNSDEYESLNNPM